MQRLALQPGTTVVARGVALSLCIYIPPWERNHCYICIICLSTYILETQGLMCLESQNEAYPDPVWFSDLSDLRGTIRCLSPPFARAPRCPRQAASQPPYLESWAMTTNRVAAQCVVIGVMYSTCRIHNGPAIIRLTHRVTPRNSHTSAHCLKVDTML